MDGEQHVFFLFSLLYESRMVIVVVFSFIAVGRVLHNLVQRFREGSLFLRAPSKLETRVHSLVMNGMRNKKEKTKKGGSPSVGFQDWRHAREG